MIDDPMTAIDRLLSLEAIRALRARYALHFDMGEIKPMMALFTDDAICSFGPEFGGDWVGRDAIKAGYDGFIARRLVARFALQHLATNSWIEFDDPNHARGHWYFTVVKTGGGEVPLNVHMAGRYQDRYVRHDGQWLIQHSFVELLNTSGEDTV